MLSGMGGGVTPVAESLPVVIVTGEKGTVSGVGGGGTPVAVSLAVMTTTGGAASCPASAFPSLKKARLVTDAAAKINAIHGTDR